MKIEILFPEVCNLFGDLGNICYLKKVLPQAEFCSTPLCGDVRFVQEKVDLVYLGAMTEQTQERVIQKLMPLRDDISKEIDGGTVFLFTGNAFEIFGDYIENEDGSRIDGLGLYRLHAKRDRQNRHNSAFLGEFDGNAVMGIKTQFSMSYTPDDSTGLFKVVKGVGLNRDASAEGIRVHNFFGTYLLGPLLVQNPPFMRYLLRLIGAENTPLAFEKEADEAYAVRLEEYRDEAFVAEKAPESNKLPIPKLPIRFKH
ncbi:MAG: hypothetical protein PUK20_00835 [Firmicutes bacterium]|nr:hypothetical protein [Bacillota bacterium]MDY4107713.1 hypothetical protein [Oscillospiraceae bacterium]